MAEGELLTQTIKRVSRGVRAVANGDTEDVVQEALARAIKSGVSLEAEQWLRTVAKRVAIDQHRRRRETPSGAPTDLEQWVTTHDGNPEDVAIRAERAAHVREALAALPPRYRRALMVYAEEDSAGAVANRLGLSAAATWTLLSRARSRLRLQLEQTGFIPALVMGRPRIRALLAAGAAAGVATTMAVTPMRPSAPAAPTEVAKPRVVQVAAPETPTKTAVPEAKPKLSLPVATEDVTSKVDDAVADAKAAPERVKLGACLGRADEIKVGLELWPVADPVEEQEQTLGSKLRSVVDKTIGLTADKSCE